jgi:hypothetical protein
LTYANLKIPVTSFDPNQRLVGTARWTVPHWLAGHQLSRYFVCGSGRGQSADELTVKLTMQSTIVADSAGRSALSTYIVANATDPGQQSFTPLNCQTTGQLETRVSDELMKTLAK